MNLTEKFVNLKAKDVIEAAENRDLGLSAEFKTEVRFMRSIEIIQKGCHILMVLQKSKRQY